jgi:thiamine phosphate synthase YjbQ (UPF0047 family)
MINFLCLICIVYLIREQMSIAKSSEEARNIFIRRVTKVLTVFTKNGFVTVLGELTTCHVVIADSDDMPISCPQPIHKLLSRVIGKGRKSSHTTLSQPSGIKHPLTEEERSVTMIRFKTPHARLNRKRFAVPSVVLRHVLEVFGFAFRTRRTILVIPSNLPSECVEPERSDTSFLVEHRAMQAEVHMAAKEVFN